MMCVPRCSKVGLGSIVLRAHTGPLWVPFSAARRRANASLSTFGETPKHGRQLPLLERPQRFLLQPFTGPLHMIAVLFEQNLVLPQILLHADGPRRLQRRVPTAIVQSPQRTTKDQTIKAAQHPLNPIPKFLDKLLPGVLL